MSATLTPTEIRLGTKLLIDDLEKVETYARQLLVGVSRWAGNARGPEEYQAEKFIRSFKREPIPAEQDQPRLRQALLLDLEAIAAYAQHLQIELHEAKPGSLETAHSQGDTLVRNVRRLPVRPADREPLAGLYRLQITGLACDLLDVGPPGQAPAATSDKYRFTREQFVWGARELGCETAVLQAVVEVEASGRGWLPSGRPLCLFERHLFHRNTKGRHTRSLLRYTRATFDPRLDDLSWPGWLPRTYGPGGENQWRRLLAAAKLNQEAAYDSTSFGPFQVLGSEAERSGWKGGAQAMVADLQQRGTEAAIEGFVQLVRAYGLTDELQRRDWAGFARRYNGPAYRVNRYDTRLATAFARYSKAA